MDITKDEAAAADALGQPHNALVDKLLFHIDCLARNAPKTLSKRQQKHIASALAIGEEMDRRKRHSIKYNSAC